MKGLIMKRWPHWGGASWPASQSLLTLGPTSRSSGFLICKMKDNGKNLEIILIL